MIATELAAPVSSVPVPSAPAVPATAAAPAPAAPRPDDDETRLRVLRGRLLFDTSACEDFTFLTEMAARICEAPYAFISLVDSERVWMKSCIGIQAEFVPRDECYCSHAILGDSTDIPDLSLDARTADLPMTRNAPHMRMYSSVTLRSSDGYPLGTLCVMDTRPRSLSDDQRRILNRLARQVMALIESRANEKTLQATLLKMERLATTDELTGLMNRRALLERLTLEVARARRSRTSLALVMIDLDFFKQVNDRYGHPGGDLVLENVGRLLRDSARVTDIAGRYGGEELCMVLPDTNLAGARIFAEGLRVKLAAFVHGGAEGPGRITASFGIAVIGDTAGDCNSLLKQADDALYRAKREGRNRVES
jgi:diguanylate cyclase (GGDEF)-like protein